MLSGGGVRFRLRAALRLAGPPVFEHTHLVASVALLENIEEHPCDGSERLENVRAAIRHHGLDLPRGAAAEQLGLVWPGAPPGASK